MNTDRKEMSANARSLYERLFLQNPLDSERVERMKKDVERGHERTIYFGNGRMAQTQRPIVLSHQVVAPHVAPIRENPDSRFNHRNMSHTARAPKPWAPKPLAPKPLAPKPSVPKPSVSKPFANNPLAPKLALASFPSEGQTKFKPSTVLLQLGTGVSFRDRATGARRSFQWKELEGVAFASNHESVVLFKRRGQNFDGLDNIMVVAGIRPMNIQPAQRLCLIDFERSLRSRRDLVRESSGQVTIHGLEHAFYKFVKQVGPTCFQQVLDPLVRSAFRVCSPKFIL